MGFDNVVVSAWSHTLQCHTSASFTGLSQYKLQYVWTDVHQDFSDFKPFNGWTQPYSKMWNSAGNTFDGCGTRVTNYIE